MKLNLPGQHGAWAFLLVPIIMVAFLGGATWAGLVFAVTWVAAYPATYFGWRGIMVRLRRGEWSRIAKREVTAAIPWLVVTAVGIIALLVMQPWVLIPGLIVLAIWCLSAWLTWIGRERGITNDLLMVVLATFSIPLMWSVAVDSPYFRNIPAPIWTAMLASAVFFFGSVLHVKSLIREADDKRWRYASLIFHVIALIGMTAFSWRFVLPFGLALARSIFTKPGTKPSHLGAMETVVAASLVLATVAGVQ